MGTCRHCGHSGRFYPAQPNGYVSWHQWAERKIRTHEQHPCPQCGRLSIWKLKLADAGKETSE